MYSDPQVIGIGDDYCVVYTAASTKILDKNWDFYKENGQLNQILRVIPRGPIVLNFLKFLNFVDFAKVRLHLAQAAFAGECFVYVIDGAG